MFLVRLCSSWCEARREEVLMTGGCASMTGPERGASEPAPPLRRRRPAGLPHRITNSSQVFEWLLVKDITSSLAKALPGYLLPDTPSNPPELPQARAPIPTQPPHHPAPRPDHPTAAPTPTNFYAHITVAPHRLHRPGRPPPTPDPTHSRMTTTHPGSRMSTTHLCIRPSHGADLAVPETAGSTRRGHPVDMSAVTLRSGRHSPPP